MKEKFIQLLSFGGVPRVAVQYRPRMLLRALSVMRKLTFFDSCVLPHLLGSCVLFVCEPPRALGHA